MNFLANPKFWKTCFTSPRYSDEKIPDLSGKIAIVTGANTGLGYATMVALAGHGARVFLACRSEQRATDAMVRAREEIKAKYPQAKAAELEFLELDLNDMKKCRESAQTFVKKGLPLHILVNNSGIMLTPFALSADGIETQFAVNHMGHFVFTLGLLERIKESQPARIVVLSSMGHNLSVKGGIDFDTLNDETASTSGSRYGRSKLANVLFGKALAKRLAGERVYVNIAHPGYVNTDLNRHAEDLAGAFYAKVAHATTNLVAMKPEVGALTQLYLASSPEIEEQDVRGKYFIPIANELEPSAYGLDDALAEKLWTFSEKLVAEKIGA